MYTMPDDASPDLADQLMRYYHRRTRGRAELVPIRDEILSVLTRLRAAKLALQDARDERIGGTAEIEYCDSELDLAMADLDRAISVVVRGDRNHEIYRRVFPTPRGEAMKQVATADQANYTRDVLREVAKEPLLAGKSEEIEAVRLAAAALQAAIDARTACYDEERAAERELAAVMARAKEVYDLSYHQTTLVYPKSPARVKSFYYRKAVARASEAAEPAESDG